MKNSQPLVTASKNAPVTRPLNAQQQRILLQLLLKLIILNPLSFTLTESPELLCLLNFLNSSVKLPKRNTIKKLVIRSWNNLKPKISNLLITNGSKIALTSDIWSSIDNKSFIAVTAHFIDNQFTVRTLLLDVKRFPHPHRGRDIAVVLMEIINTFGLNNVVSITTDNGANMLSGMVLFGAKYFSSFHGEVSSRRCLAHIFHLIVKQLMKPLRNEIKKVRVFTSKLHYSVKLKEELQHVVNATTHNANVNIPTDVSTRFNSTYLMLRSYLQLLPFINDYLDSSSDNSISSLKLSDVQALQLMKLKDFLLDFYKATKFLSGEQYVGVSLMTSIWEKNTEKVLAPANNLPQWLRSSCSRTAYLILKYNPFVYNSLTFACMFLDPRFAWMNMTEKLKKDSYFNDFKSLYESKIVLQRNNESLGSGSMNNASLDDEDSFLLSLQRPVVYQEKDELERYGDVVPINMKDCPLQWWKVHQLEFPILSNLARDYLTIPATSVPCERVFSIAGHIKSKKRNSLSDDSLSSLVVLKDWLA
ncbi:hypothetical protein RCL1_005851 [Eukaryota sp. TZLM3-RCL]